MAGTPHNTKSTAAFLMGGVCGYRFLYQKLFQDKHWDWKLTKYKIEIALLTAFSRNLPYIDNAGAVQLYRESGVAGPYEG